MSTRAARFEIVHADSGWFARARAANGRKVWQTEILTKRVNAERAVDIFAGLFGCYLDGFEGQQQVIRSGPEVMCEVREVDERTPPFVAPPPEPPFYLGSSLSGLFWHDRDYHWRNCLDECEKLQPPVGAEVVFRFGRHTITRADLDERTGGEGA